LRIVTLLPSATEIVCALGLADKLVGVSHGCNRPPIVGALPRMTSTRIPRAADSKTIDACVRDHLESGAALYELALDALREARPDVVVSQGLCDVCAVSTGAVDEAVRSLPGSPVLVDLTPSTLNDVFADIERVAAALDATAAARTLLTELRDRRDAVAARTAAIPLVRRPRVAFLEWLIPPFNGGHWNPELVRLAGGIDLFGAGGEPSRTLDWPEVAAGRPDVVFIACCGFTADRAMQDVGIVRDTAAWGRLPAVRHGRVYLADGNVYSSPGPRLIDGLELLAHGLHPDVHPLPAAAAPLRRYTPGPGDLQRRARCEDT
jgi:iron complex transport system substrate-binding protein